MNLDPVRLATVTSEAYHPSSERVYANRGQPSTQSAMAILYELLQTEDLSSNERDLVFDTFAKALVAVENEAFDREHLFFSSEALAALREKIQRDEDSGFPAVPWMDIPDTLIEVEKRMQNGPGLSQLEPHPGLLGLQKKVEEVENLERLLVRLVDAAHAYKNRQTYATNVELSQAIGDVRDAQNAGRVARKVPA